MPFKIENQVLIEYQEEPGVKEVIVPDGVTEIGISAFALNENIESIVLPESVKIIGAFAFRDCPHFYRLAVGNGIEEVSDYAFSFCHHIREITYCGFRLPLPPFSNITADRIFQVLTGKNLEPFNSYDRTYNHIVLWVKFAVNPEDKKLLKYIRKHFQDMYPSLICHGQPEILHTLLEKTCFVTKYHIDNLIQLAIENQKYDMQMMLTEYKQQKGWYQEISDKLKL